jgi:hypothetical protein
MILCVSQFNHENAVDVRKTASSPHFSQPDPVRGKIPCRLKPENDNSWPWEDDSGRKTTSRDKASPSLKLWRTGRRRDRTLFDILARELK